MACSSLARQAFLTLCLNSSGRESGRLLSEDSHLLRPSYSGIRNLTLKGAQSLKLGGGRTACLEKRRERLQQRLHVSATALSPSPPSETGTATSASSEVDWDNLGFGLRATDYMYVMMCAQDGEWQAGELRPYGNLEMSPSAGVLNYGQGVFEGMKAYNSEDGRVLIFRPSENAARMIESADRLSMPAPPIDAFVTAVKQTVAANKNWIPPHGKGSLYIRPLLIGTGPILGLAPAPEYTFLIYVSPVGNYFKGGTLTPISLKVEEHFHRATPGGTGAAKTIGNYSPIPPHGKGSLYIRPLLIGTGPILGLAPAPEYTFLIYVSPVGNYFKGGTLTPISLKVEEHFHRATPGGTGAAKTIGNYSPVLKAQLEAKRHGYSDVLYLDAVSNTFVEEVSSCNIFIVKDGKIATPELKGTILPGITRKSVVELSRSLGYEVTERQVSVDELMAADEVFCTGTAVVISPVGSITYRDATSKYNGGEVGPVSQRLYTTLTDLQMGRSPDHMGWTAEVL
eukprot:jgi/Mesen1/2199/ME000152S01282